MRTLRVIGLCFAGLGLALAIVAIVLGWQRQAVPSGWRMATGQVVGHESDRKGDGYRAIVRFTAEAGREAEVRAGVSTSWRSGEAGEAAPVAYDPSRPQDARIWTTMERLFLPGLFGLIGGVFFVIGAGVLVWLALARRRDDRLRLTGDRYAGRVLGVTRNPSVRFDNQQAWRIEAEWTDILTGEKRIVRSRNLDFDPSPRLRDVIDVYVDRTNRERSLVDVAPIERART